LYELCEGSTIQEVSRKHRIPSYTTLERIYYSIASKKAKERQTATEASFQEGMVLSLDEIAVKKGHQYETVLMDAKAGSVMGMHADRQYDSAINLLSRNVLSKEMVQTVILDMWEPYHKEVRALFPSASIVIPRLKKARFLLLKGYEKLRKNQQFRLNDILEEYPALSIAYYLKGLFRDFYRTDHYDQAKECLEEWIWLAKQSPFVSFQQAANTLERWKEPILQYFLCPYTNARMEGNNHKIKNIKRRAYGYRNLERFRLRVFLECTRKTTGSQAV
jgi:transposase